MHVTTRNQSLDVLRGSAVLCLILDIWMAIAVVPGALAQLSDFSVFYWAGHRLMTAPSTLCISPNGAPWTHLPYEAILFAPLSLLTFKWAYLTWIGVNLAALGFAWNILRPNIELIAFAPLWLCAVWGQDSIILMLLFAIAFSCAKNNLPFRTGIVLGMGMFRFQNVLPIIFFMMIWREWRVIRGFILSSGVALTISAIIVSPRAYLETIRMLLNHPTLYSPLDRMPTIRGMVHVLVSGKSGVAWLTAIYVIMTAFCGLVGRRFTLPDRFNLSIFAVSLMSFHFFVHDMSILLVPLSAKMSERKGTAVRTVLLLSSLLGILNWHMYLVALGTLAAGILFILDRDAEVLYPTPAH